MTEIADDAVDQRVGRYVYGIVPSGTELPEGTGRVSEAPIRLVESRGIAAVVAEVPDVDEVGTPEDIVAHSKVLDTLARTTAVLPMTFGTVLEAEEDVVDALLEPYGEQFADLLHVLGDDVQYTLLVRFDRDTVLREVLEEEPEAVDLRAQIVDTNEDQTRPQRIRLGELVVTAMERKAEQERRTLLRALDGVSEEVVQRPLHQAEDLLEVAALVRRDRTDRFDRTVDDLAAQHHPRMRFRLLGPQAPYDFVPEVSQRWGS